MDQESSFKCPNCSFLFTMKRKPVSLPCGDSICNVCSKKPNKCGICFFVIDPKIDYPINKPLMKLAESKKDDIYKIVKICFIGQSIVGKTSLINALSGQPFNESIGPTVGIDFAFCHRDFKGSKLKYQLWDTAGQQRFQSICKSYYQDVDFVILTYDLSASPSFNKMRKWIQEANLNCRENTNFIFVGNKKDLVNQSTTNRAIQKNTWQFIQQRYPHIEVSCKTNFGINQFWNLIDQNTIKFVEKPKLSQTVPSTPIKNLRAQTLKIQDRIKKRCC